MDKQFQCQHGQGNCAICVADGNQLSAAAKRIVTPKILFGAAVSCSMMLVSACSSGTTQQTAGQPSASTTTNATTPGAAPSSPDKALQTHVASKITSAAGNEGSIAVQSALSRTTPVIPPPPPPPSGIIRRKVVKKNADGSDVAPPQQPEETSTTQPGAAGTKQATSSAKDAAGKSAAPSFEAARQLYFKGNLDEAVVRLNSVIEKDPSYLPARRLRARALLVKAPQTAIDDLNTAIQIKATPADYSNLAFAQCCLGNYEQGKASALKSLQMDPKYAEGHHNLAWCYNGLKQYDQAIAEENKAMQLNMKEPWNYNNRAWAYKDLGKFKEALADFDLALKKKPDYKEAYIGRSQLFEKMAQQDKETVQKLGGQ